MLLRRLILKTVTFSPHVYEAKWVYTKPTRCRYEYIIGRKVQKSEEIFGTIRLYL